MKRHGITRFTGFVRSIGLAIAVAIGFWSIVLMIFEEQFMYFPSPHNEQEYRAAQEALGARDQWFTTEDGVRLHGWYVPARNPLATLVMSHGNAGNIAHRFELLRRLQRAGFNTFIYDYRGYGLSEGTPSEEGLYADGRAALDAARRVAPTDSIPIILFGTSLGGAVAVDVALRRPADGLILEATFTSAKEMARALYPFLPVQLFMKTRFNTIEKLKTVHLPLLVIHGEQDEIVPLSMGRKLFETALPPKRFYEIPRSHHNDTFLVGGEEYLHQLQSFVSTLKPASHTDIR